MTTLITGATGKTGRRVARRLQALDHDVRSVTRHSTPRFDWHDRTTWAEAVAGCESAYLTFQPDLGLPGADEVIGAVAVTARLDKGYDGRVLELTGPQLVTFEEAAHTIGGPTVAYRSVPTEDYIAILTAAGLPAADAAGLAYLFEEVLDGRNAYVTGDVESVLGRPARSIGGHNMGAQ